MSSGVHAPTPSEPDVRLPPHPALHVFMPRLCSTSTAHWCSFDCISSTRDCASEGSGHDAPTFTSGLLDQRQCCEHTGPLRHVHGFPALGLLRVLRPTPLASTGDRSSRPFSALENGKGPTGWFPRSLSNPSTGSAPSYAPATSPPLRRRLSLWPPDRRHHPAKEFSAHAGANARCNPAPIRQIRAGGLDLRSVQPLVSRVRLSVSLAGPTPSDSADVSRRCQGRFHPHRCPPDQAALSYNMLSATSIRRWSLTTARFKSASWRSMSVTHLLSGSNAVKSRRR